MSTRRFQSDMEIINTAAQAYKGLIPEDCWKDPYMPEEELRQEIEEGVNFWTNKKRNRRKTPVFY